MSIVQAAPVDGWGKDAFAHWRSRFVRLHLDLGCGDARFARREALGTPDLAVVGIDTCLANVRIRPKTMPPNLRLIEADARAIGSLPAPGGADRITINFPYGSLLHWLVDEGDACISALTTIAAPGAALEIRTNASALKEIGVAPEDVERSLRDAFARQRAWGVRITTMGQAALRGFPSTWARRIGSGRPTTALEIIARRIE